MKSCKFELARYDGLDPRTLREALEHADGCASCDGLLDEAEALSGDLRSLAAFDGARHAPSRLEQSVMASFARSQARTRHAMNVRVGVAASLIGVAALATFTVILLRHPRPAGEPPQPPPASASPSRPNAAIVQSASADSDAADGALAAFEAQHGSAGSFLPLTDTFDPASLDGDAVLRVALSRADLAGLGLSARPDDSRPVLADMIVTSDGTPQAIRLLAGR